MNSSKLQNIFLKQDWVISYDMKKKGFVIKWPLQGVQLAHKEYVNKLHSRYSGYLFSIKLCLLFQKRVRWLY